LQNLIVFGQQSTVNVHPDHATAARVTEPLWLTIQVASSIGSTVESLTPLLLQYAGRPRDDSAGRAALARDTVADDKRIRVRYRSSVMILKR
jgi:hypothetical protein